MNDQLDIFKSCELRDQGIKRALDAAEKKDLSWGEIAYTFLIRYAERHKEFLAEDVRSASKYLVPQPPSNRAWGSIFVKANKNGIIKADGFGFVKNPKAHRTPATKWRSKI